jgi:hypothetical protein
MSSKLLGKLNALAQGRTHPGIEVFKLLFSDLQPLSFLTLHTVSRSIWHFHNLCHPNYIWLIGLSQLLSQFSQGIEEHLLLSENNSLATATLMLNYTIVLTLTQHRLLALSTE